MQEQQCEDCEEVFWTGLGLTVCATCAAYQEGRRDGAEGSTEAAHLRGVLDRIRRAVGLPEGASPDEVALFVEARR